MLSQSNFQGERVWWSSEEPGMKRRGSRFCFFCMGAALVAASLLFVAAFPGAQATDAEETKCATRKG